MYDLLQNLQSSILKKSLNEWMNELQISISNTKNIQKINFL